MLAAALAGILLSVFLVVLAITKTSNHSGSSALALTPISVSKKISYGWPIRLTIPSIGVDATIEGVGLTDGGELGVPIGPLNAGWYKAGPRPGELGNAVIDGHFGLWKDGTATVFNNILNLQKGDKLYVSDKNGKPIVFVVSGFGIYDPAQDSTSIFKAGDRKAHLNLITCNGIWIPSQKTYSNRLIVFSDKQI